MTILRNMYRKISRSSSIANHSHFISHPLHLTETPQIHKPLKFHCTPSSIVDRFKSFRPIRRPFTFYFSSTSTPGKGNSVDYSTGDFDFVPLSGFKKYMVKIKTLLASERVEHGSVLRINLKGKFSDGPVGTDSQVLSLPQLSENLMKAAYDPRVSALFVYIDAFDCGWGKADEIRRQIFNFKKSGKKVIAFMPTFWGFESGVWYQNKSYYIASECHEIYAPPNSTISSPETATLTKLTKRSLKKDYTDLIEWEHKTVGKYKIAGLNSDEGWEMMKAIEDDIRSNWLDMVSCSRKITKKDLLTFFGSEDFHETKNWIDCGLASGLMDGDKIITGLTKRFGPPLDFKIYSQVKKCTVGISNSREKIGIIRVCGAIDYGGDIMIHDLIENIRTVGSSKSLKAIILRIDSPGGNVLLADQLWREINILASKIPVISSLSDEAASGAYLIATGAGTIVAEKLTIIGSIGVRLSHANIKKIYEYFGFKKEVLSKGKYAELFENDHRLLMPHEEERIKNELQEIYKHFVDKVAMARSLSVDEVEEIAQGRLWTGKAAMNNRLVDALGGLSRAVAIAKLKANIPQNRPINLVELSV